MGAMSKQQILFRMVAFAMLCFTVSVGCGTFVNHRDAKTKPDNSRLHWCIGLIEDREIERGMSRSKLSSLFGDTLFIQDDTHAVVPLVPWKISNKDDVQWGPYWKITFDLNREGNVTDYAISKIPEK